MARAWICVAVSLMLCAAAESAWASFPGRNGKIAYLWIGESAYRAGPTATSIRTVDPRTGVVRVLRDCPLRADAPSTYTECSVRAPSYAPDGSQLAFAVTHTTPGAPGEALRVEPGLATMAATGGSLAEHVTEHDYLAVSWSPAGARFLLDRFPMGSGADNAVFLATLDGTELSQVALGQGADWSSRGEIAFGRYRARACLPMCEDIFITRLGGAPRRLTHRGGSSPSWSPHGYKLAFVRRDNVYIVRRNGRGLHRVTRRGGSNPAWSPDGRWIAFIRNGDAYVIRPNGEDRRRLVHGAVTALGEGPQVQSIDWQAIPRR
jgi:Tol biopolymer transport system component